MYLLTRETFRMWKCACLHTLFICDVRLILPQANDSKISNLVSWHHTNPNNVQALHCYLSSQSLDQVILTSVLSLFKPRKCFHHCLTSIFSCKSHSARNRRSLAWSMLPSRSASSLMNIKNCFQRALNRPISLRVAIRAFDRVTSLHRIVWHTATLARHVGSMKQALW